MTSLDSPTGTVVLRPNPRTLLVLLAQPPLSVVILLALLSLTLRAVAHPAVEGPLVIFAASVIALIAILVALYSAIAMVTVTAETVTWRKLIRRGCFRKQDVAAFRYDFPGRHFIVGDRNGYRLLSLHTALWSSDSLEILSRSLEDQ